MGTNPDRPSVKAPGEQGLVFGIIALKELGYSQCSGIATVVAPIERVGALNVDFSGSNPDKHASVNENRKLLGGVNADPFDHLACLIGDKAHSCHKHAHCRRKNAHFYDKRAQFHHKTAQ